MADKPTFVVDYYVNGENIWQNEHSDMIPTIGQGVHLAEVFYRVVDVWFNYEKHAPVNYGHAVFLEEIDTPDVFNQVSADYYTQSLSTTPPPPAQQSFAREPGDPNPLTMGF